MNLTLVSDMGASYRPCKDVLGLPIYDPDDNVIELCHEIEWVRET